MEVKIYREPENQDLIINEQDLQKYNELALELGLCTIEQAEQQKCPSVYVCLNSAMQRQLKALCPVSVDISNYRRSTIPLEVLQAYKFCKDQDMYEGFLIMYDDVAPDPMLIGWNYQNEEARQKKYSWRRDFYLIARWGDCAMELPDLLEMGFQKIKAELIDKAKKAQSVINNILADPDLYTRDIIGNNMPRIDIDTRGSGSI